ncbi:MAG: hypothetical protein HC877_17645 [Thioploca sp.]|nr:hypothetical protein [Thioploca sp.]
MKVNNLIRMVNTWAIPRIKDNLPLWCFPKYQLRFKAYCVGLPKTGTTSIHAMFSQNYRSAHEPEGGLVCNRILAYVTGKISKSELTRFVRRRDRRLSLEMDSNNDNYFLLDILVSEFSEAKFILTIRDCYSWLDSFLNHHYLGILYVRANYPFRKNCPMKRYDIIFGIDEFKHTSEEKILVENGLYTLDGYFRYWREHNQQVMAIIPKEKLLIVKTKEINQYIPKIEQFLELTPGSLRDQVRENVRREKQKYHFLSKIDKSFLEERANFYCKELMDKYFPEVKGFNS